MKNREELERANEEFRASLTSEVDRTQEQVFGLAKKAFIAGGVVLTLNVIRNAFFVKDKKKRKLLKPKSEATFLSKELSSMVIVELLSFAGKKLAKYMEEQDQKVNEKDPNA